MYNYNIKENKNNNFFDILNENKESYFAIDVPDVDYMRYLDLDLPEPNILKRFNNSYKIIYLIDGYFGTKKSKEYFNDIKEKLISTFKGRNWKFTFWFMKKYKGKTYYLPSIDFDDIDILHYGKFDLSDFEGLDRVKKIRKSMFEVNQTRDKIFTLMGENYGGKVFENTRWLIYQSKITGKLSEENSFDILMQQNEKHGWNKEFSYLRSLSRNMTEWTEKFYNLGKHSPDYYNNYYKNVRSKKDGNMKLNKFLELEATRKRKVSELKILDGIKELLNTDMKFNKSNLSKITGITRKTLLKYEYLYINFI